MKVRWRFVCWPVAAGLVWAVMAGVAAQSASASGGWVWTETNYNAPSGATTFGWGAASPCRPVSGDFTSTGNSHVGLACYDASTGWTWREDTGSGTGGQVLFGWGGPSGNPPACQPIAGDWAGYGIDHVGLACYSPSSGWTWREDTGSQGGGQILFGWGGADGDPSHCHPITGDWNNYGHDHVGLACWTSSGWTWHEDTGSQGGGAIVFGWGAASDTEADCTAISGNWTGGTQTRVGLGCWTSGGWIWREATGGQGGGQVIFGWGGASSTPPTTIPLTGDWNGDGTTTVATVNSNGLQLNYSGGGGGAACAQDNSCNPQDFADALLAYPGVGAPATFANEYAVETWEGAENGGAGCPGQPPYTAPWPTSPGAAGNPLNTDRPEPGSTNYNSVGVQNYNDADGHTCWYWGIKANGDALTNGLYPNVISVLQSPSPDAVTQCQRLGVAVGNSPWGTGDFASDC